MTTPPDTPTLGRYRVLSRVSRAADGVELWHAHDQTLDRPVAIRFVPVKHPNLDAVTTAAQVAATVEDRRLLRVLDIIDVPAAGDRSSGRGIVSEWVSGRTLEQVLAERNGTPFGAPEALDLVTDVARAIATGLPHGIGHGRLRPSSVLISDVGETRVRGLGVEGALFGVELLSDGSPAASVDRSDVDSLGGLTYLLTTGYWPGAAACSAPAAPLGASAVLPPSQVRAAVPRGIDDLVSRSLASAELTRGRETVPDAAAFAAAAGAALHHIAPVTTTTMKPVSVGPPTPTHRILVGVGRVGAVLAAVLVVAGLGWLGWQLVSAPAEQSATDTVDSTAILTVPAKPVDEIAIAGLEQPITILGYRSYDPYGDDDGNGKSDKRKGQENDDLAITVNDVDPDTAWLTSQYDSADLDGKAGVGLILDLGTEQEVQQVTANLIGRGTEVEVRVSDSIKRDPALWTPLGAAFAPGDAVEVRSPRPVTGRYVLLWLTQLPPVEGSSGFQGGVRSVSVT